MTNKKIAAGAEAARGSSDSDKSAETEMEGYEAETALIFSRFKRFIIKPLICFWLALFINISLTLIIAAFCTIKGCTGSRFYDYMLHSTILFSVTSVILYGLVYRSKENSAGIMDKLNNENPPIA